MKQIKVIVIVSLLFLLIGCSDNFDSMRGEIIVYGKHIIESSFLEGNKTAEIPLLKTLDLLGYQYEWSDIDKATIGVCGRLYCLDFQKEELFWIGFPSYNYLKLETKKNNYRFETDEVMVSDSLFSKICSKFHVPVIISMDFQNRKVIIDSDQRQGRIVVNGKVLEQECVIHTEAYYAEIPFLRILEAAGCEIMRAKDMSQAHFYIGEKEFVLDFSNQLLYLISDPGENLLLPVPDSYCRVVTFLADDVIVDDISLESILYKLGLKTNEFKINFTDEEFRFQFKY